MMKKFFLAILCTVMSIGLSVAQTRTVTGIVTSADDGQPVIGASIQVKGTMTGTVTNLDGNFSLDVNASARTLMVSYIGMESQEVNIQPSMRIVLRTSSIMVDEVVVTAMGISREKKALGYAVQDVKSEQLTQAASPNLSSALQGKVSGIEIKSTSGMPGASSQITIRGARSFTGNNTPLYVIDGMPIASTADYTTGNSVSGSDVANRAVDIDPNDIESINILKGQAASALYGLRASNGVIVITTKSGKGAAKGKPQVTFNTSLSFDDINRVPDQQKLYAQGSGGKYNPTASTSWGPLISELPNDAAYGGNMDNAYTKRDGMHQGMYYVPQRANAGLDPWVTPQTYDNIQGFFNTGVTWNNSINVAQATEKGSYAFSLGNTKQDGIIPSTGMERYNAKFTAETKLHEQWTTGATANYVNTYMTKSTGANDGIVATVYPAPPSYDLNGIPSYYEGNIYKQSTYRGTTGFDAANWSVDNNEFNERTSRFFGSSFLNFTTNMGTANQKLSLKYQLGIDSYTTHYQDIWGYGHKNSDGQIENYGYTTTAFNSLATANYDWNINEDLVFNALVGNEVVHDANKTYYQYGAKFNFPGWNHINNTSVKDNEETQTSDRTVGFFGNLSLSYKNMLFLNATGRNDIVSTMPRGNRSFFYPSVSLGFIFTELETLQNDILTYGKVRASYAEVGQAGKYYPNYYAVPSYGGGFYGFTPIIYPLQGQSAFTPYSTVYDPNLKPQNTRSYEFGVDLSFLRNLISVNYTYSRQNVKDQIFGVPLAASTGYGQLVTNGGSIHTNSHEITLNVNPIRLRNVDWNIGFNWTKVDNYVDALAPGVESIFLGGFVTPQVRAGVGDKFPVIYGVGYARDDNGNQLVDANGLPIAGEPQVIGKVSPDFILGMNTSLRIFKANISAVFDWKNGGQMYSGTNGLFMMYGTDKKTEKRGADDYIIVNGYKEDGTKNDIKIQGANAIQNYYNVNNNIDESSIFNTSFVKLREVAVSYPVFERSWLNVTLNVFARNILLWTELPNIDPESSQGNNNMIGAFERFSLPQTSSYGFGLNVKF